MWTDGNLICPCLNADNFQSKPTPVVTMNYQQNCVQNRTTYLPNHNNIQKLCSSVVFFFFNSPTKWDMDLNSQFTSYCNKKNIFEMTIIFPKLVGQGNIYTLYTKIKFYCYKILDLFRLCGFAFGQY